MTMPDLLPFLGEVALRSSLVLAVVFALLFVMKQASASERHLVMLCGLLVVVFLPVGLLLSPKFLWTISLPQQAETNGSTRKMTSYFLEDPKNSQPSAPPSVAENKPSIPESLTISNGLAASILGGMLVQVLMLGRAAWSWQKIRHRAVKTHLSDKALERARIFAGAREVPPIFASDQVTVPLLAGWLRPAIILPAEAHTWPSQRLVMVLCHELAHFRRGDALLLPLICALRVLYWWHPLVWLALGRLLRERETACDDLVLNQHFRATDYADLIVDTARQTHTLRWQSGALAMASPSHLCERIRAILNPRLNRRPASRTTILTGSILAFALGWFFVAAQVQAEDQPVASNSNPAPNGSKPQIELEFKLVQIDEKTYISHQKQIDAEVPSLDAGSLISQINNLPGVSLLSAPSVTTQDGLKANVDIVREMSYATQFDKDKDGKIVPSDFKTRDVGLSVEGTPTLTADKRYVSLKFKCKLTSFEGWKEISTGGRLPIFDTVSTETEMLIDKHGDAVWVGGSGTTRAYLTIGDENNHPPSTTVTAPKRILLLITARPMPAEISKTPPKMTESKPAVKFSITLVDVDEKAYQRQAAAMDEAIRKGDLHFFDNAKDGWGLRTADIVLLVGQRGWYSEGAVQSYIESAHQEMRNGKPWTTLQANAVFLGLNADFTWSKDRLSMDSFWQVTEPSYYKPLGEKAKTGKISPGDLPEEKFHVATYADKSWDMTPGKEHAFWIGETFGVLRHIPMSVDEMIKTRKPSRLAVFLTEQPVNN
jgi:beta-lactamase regulating signal transducer with metallopeptidase domain